MQTHLRVRNIEFCDKNMQDSAAYAFVLTTCTMPLQSGALPLQDNRVVQDNATIMKLHACDGPNASMLAVRVLKSRAQITTNSKKQPSNYQVLGTAKLPLSIEQLRSGKAFCKHVQGLECLTSNYDGAQTLTRLSPPTNVGSVSFQVDIEPFENKISKQDAQRNITEARKILAQDFKNEAVITQKLKAKWMRLNATDPEISVNVVPEVDGTDYAEYNKIMMSPSHCQVHANVLSRCLDVAATIEYGRVDECAHHDIVAQSLRVPAMTCRYECDLNSQDQSSERFSNTFGLFQVAEATNSTVSCDCEDSAYDEIRRSCALANATSMPGFDNTVHANLVSASQTLQACTPVAITATANSSDAHGKFQSGVTHTCAMLISNDEYNAMCDRGKSLLATPKCNCKYGHYLTHAPKLNNNKKANRPVTMLEGTGLVLTPQEYVASKSKCDTKQLESMLNQVKTQYPNVQPSTALNGQNLNFYSTANECLREGVHMYWINVQKCTIGATFDDIFNNRKNVALLATKDFFTTSERETMKRMIYARCPAWTVNNPTPLCNPQFIASSGSNVIAAQNKTNAFEDNWAILRSPQLVENGYNVCNIKLAPGCVVNVCNLDPHLRQSKVVQQTNIKYQ